MHGKRSALPYGQGQGPPASGPEHTHERPEESRGHNQSRLQFLTKLLRLQSKMKKTGFGLQENRILAVQTAMLRF